MPTRTTWTQWRLQTAHPSCSSLAAMTLCVRCGTGGPCGRTDRSRLVIWLATETASPSSIARFGGGKGLANYLSVNGLLFLMFLRLLCQGDARYLISNSKDQSIKLWDIRKFSPKEGLAASRLAVTQQNWDYRWQQVPQRGEERQGCWEWLNQQVGETFEHNRRREE